MFRVSSFRFRGKGPNVKTYQICPSVFIKNEYLTREGSPFNDCGHSTAAFVFVLLCFSFRPIISVFLKSPSTGDIAVKDGSAE